MALNPDNLRGPFTPEEARRNGLKGAVASAKVRRKKRLMRDTLKAYLSGKVEGSELTAQEAITLALMEKAMTGDVRAYEAIRDTVGEKPADRQETKVSGGVTLRWLE